MLALPAFLPSMIFLSLPKIRSPGTLGPFTRSATARWVKDWLSTEDLTLNTSTRIVELKFLKRGCPRPKKYNNKKTVQHRTAEGIVTDTNSPEHWKNERIYRNAPITADLRNINGAV